MTTTDSGTRDYDELFRQADVALYHMKRGGRGGFFFYDDLNDEERNLLEESASTALSGIDGSEEEN